MNAKRTFALIAVILTVIASMLVLIPFDSDGEASKSTHLGVTSNTGVITARDTGEAIPSADVPIYGATYFNSPGNNPVYRITLYYGESVIFNFRDPDGLLLSQLKYELNSNGERHSYIYNQYDYTRLDVYEKVADADLTDKSFNWCYGPKAGSWVELGMYGTGLSSPSTLYVWGAMEDEQASFSVDPSYSSKASVAGYMARSLIMFNVNGGSGSFETMEDMRYSSTAASTVSFTMPAEIPTRDGYNFRGWSESATGASTLYDASTTCEFPAGTSRTMYAIWQQDTVNVTLMDGDQIHTVMAVPRGTVPVLPSDLTKADNTFVGWFADDGFNTPWDTSTPVTANITLYAGWVPDLKFTTDPVADCRITKLSASKYLFDATVSKDYSTSAASVEWKVYKEGSLEYESTGPYMTYQFMDYGTYSVELKITNSNGVSSTHNEEVTLEEPREGPSMTAIVAMTVMVLLVAIVIGRMVM